MARSRNCVVDAGHYAFTLFNYEKAIYAGKIEMLNGAAWPVNLYGVDRRCLAQAEMKPLIV
jgi:hypothetical protein